MRDCFYVNSTDILGSLPVRLFNFDIYVNISDSVQARRQIQLNSQNYGHSNGASMNSPFHYRIYLAPEFDLTQISFRCDTGCDVDETIVVDIRITTECLMG